MMQFEHDKNNKSSGYKNKTMFKKNVKINKKDVVGM
jgi:hypothetical protein